MQKAGILTNLGEWAAGPPWIVDVNYLAATDGFVVVVGSLNTNLWLNIWTDAATPAGTLRQQDLDQSADNDCQSAICPVRRGEYWRVEGGVDDIYWIPLDKK